jgi:deoxyhypusine monooxygenase
MDWIASLIYCRRHEIAFVFGQLLSTHSVPALLQVLEDCNESDMVRHEAAEALGGIATPEVLPYLKLWMNKKDAPRVVRESCQVAIDMWEVRNPLSRALLYLLTTQYAVREFQ